MPNVTTVIVTEFEETIVQVTPFQDVIVEVPGEGVTVGIFDESFDESFE